MIQRSYFLVIGREKDGERKGGNYLDKENTLKINRRKIFGEGKYVVFVEERKIGEGEYLFLVGE